MTSRVVVAVVERPEPVFVIEPGSAREWGLYAYHIGNRHQPVMLTDRSIVCPDVPGVEQLLNQQHIPLHPGGAAVHAGHGSGGTSALNSSPLLALLHLCDSLLPIGGFSCSDGLESGTASGAIATADGLRRVDGDLSRRIDRARGGADGMARLGSVSRAGLGASRRSSIRKSPRFAPRRRRDAPAGRWARGW